MLNAPFQKEISANYNKAHSAFLHSEKCRENRAARRVALKNIRKKNTQKFLYWSLFGVCIFFTQIIILGWFI